MLKKIIVPLLFVSTLAFGVFAQDAPTTSVGNDEIKCEKWTARLKGHQDQLNEAKDIKIGIYDNATDKLVELGNRYVSHGDEDVQSAAKQLLEDADTFRQLVHEGNDEMQTGIVGHYDELVMLVEAALESAIACNVQSLTYDLENLREDWGSFVADREYVKGFWTNTIKADLSALRDAIRNSRIDTTKKTESE